MELFSFLRWFLIIVLSVNLLPTCIPMVALAYKMKQGQQPIEMETSHFWIRACLAGGGLAIFSALLVGADWLLVYIDFPPGFVHLAALMIYLPVSIWYLYWTFALDELQEALVMFLLYTGLPAIVLVVCLTLDIHLPTLLAESWLLPVS